MHKSPTGFDEMLHWKKINLHSFLSEGKNSDTENHLDDLLLSAYFFIFFAESKD